MASITETKISSGEIGMLWMSYQIKSLLEQMTGLFAKKAMEQQAKDILVDYSVNIRTYLNEVITIYDKEKAVVPLGFSGKDVFDDAPALFDDIFYIMFLRIMSKVIMEFDSTHMGMAYRRDVREFYMNAWKFSQETYDTCTDYLTEQGVLARPPYVTMPKEVEFIKESKYMSGFQLFRGKRALNTLEISYLFTITEIEIMLMQLTTGFAQAAKEKEVREYFMRGKEISKKIISGLNTLVLDSDIQMPTTWAGKATDSTVPPFSDKLMLYTVNIMASSTMASNAFGMAFSSRSDLPGKLAVIMQDTANYARDGGRLMIQHKWLEEPPQMEDRNQLIYAV